MSPKFLSPIPKSILLSFIAVIILGTVIRLVAISVPLYGDELATVSIWGSMPLLDIPSHYEYPNNHIFHTLVVATIFKIFGLDPFLLRTPVLICGIGSIALAFFTTHRITRNFHAGLAVSLLIAINGGHIFYSTNARGYMLILLIGQYIFHRLIVWIDESKVSLRGTKEFFNLKELSVLAGLMMIGTWTLPTFVFFEGSLGLFFLISIVLSKPSRWLDPSSQYFKNLTVIMICLLGLYVQYFILISPEMFKLGLSNAAQSELRSFPIAVLNSWIQPIESSGIFSIILVVMGFYTLFRINRTTFILVVCLLVFPPAITYLASLSGLFAITPHARVFFYLQPIFILCSVIGVLGIFNQLRNKLGKLAGKIVMGLILTLITIMSGKELLQVTWPDRFSYPRLDLVTKFLEKLNSNDLVLLSHRPHIEYYLYGGKETTKRVNKIIDEGKLGDIYFVEYGEKEESDTLKINKEGIEYLHLNDYLQIVKTEEKSESIIIPIKLFISEQRIGDFIFRKVNPEFVFNNYVLGSPADLTRWNNTLNSKPLKLEPPSMHPGELAALKLLEPSILIAKTEDELNDTFFSININLISSEKNLGKKVSYLHAVEEGGQYVYKNAWLLNEWVLDHPYGPNILNIDWQTKIFITEGRQPVEIIRTSKLEQGEFGRLRGIQSYRLVMKKNKLKSGGDKL